ncbi:MAG: hypothetical protein B7Z75_08615 [Acidocella sp. 20-57-95]|nr:MAG: hypothetical protein B7Z75_08615 [Acidocella sp. 20-57-95]OYV60758.1 MAG: hypothetical protein B7Z71_05760 [Acidocella sp. 21-58-7]HQT64280.1 hypothetical protein [Acidocella sp.]HQU04479.1 hypothetical protein [Acidocella sp.]
MILTHRQYIRFLRGGTVNVQVVAFLPGDLAAQMPTLSTDVRIDGAYAKKLWEKHHLGHEALGVIQSMINRGWCTKTRPNQLDFLYVDSSGRQPKRYVLGVKSAKSGQETWLTTLHLTDELEMRRRLSRAKQKGQMIRTAVWD